MNKTVKGILATVLTIGGFLGSRVFGLEVEENGVEEQQDQVEVIQTTNTSRSLDTEVKEAPASSRVGEVEEQAKDQKKVDEEKVEADETNEVSETNQSSSEEGALPNSGASTQNEGVAQSQQPSSSQAPNSSNVPTPVPAQAVQNNNTANTGSESQAVQQVSKAAEQATEQAKREAEELAKAEAERKEGEAIRQAEIAERQRLEREAAERVAAELAKAPKYAPNSVYLNGTKVSGNVNGNVVSGVGENVLNAHSVMITDSSGNARTVGVGAIYTVNENNTRLDTGQNVSVILNGNAGVVFIQTVNANIKNVAQGY